jgi:hypothetical protein
MAPEKPPRSSAWPHGFPRKLKPVLTRQPGGTPTGDRIREILLDARSTGLAPMTEMALMFADRAQAIAQVIEPALAQGESSSATASPTPPRPTRAAAASSALSPCSNSIASSAATSSQT